MCNIFMDGDVMNKMLFEYIKRSPTAYHACESTAKILEGAGYTELYEGGEWNITEGGKYFVRRNGSSLIAFRGAEKCKNGFMITASHSDSPCLKIKDNPALSASGYERVSTEVYGGPIYSTWLDRPLAIAGRVSVAAEDGVEIKLVDSKTPNFV